MKNPNLNKIIAENLDKSKFQSKSVPSLPTDSWLNQYKKGGGYFPEYDSWAPPRHADGGLLQYELGGDECRDAQGNVIPCDQQRLQEYGSDAYTAMAPFYETLYGAANKYKNERTGKVSDLNSARATAKAFLKHPEVLFMKRHQLPSEVTSMESNPYGVQSYTTPISGGWYPTQWGEPIKLPNIGGFFDGIGDFLERRSFERKTRRGIKKQRNCYYGKCYDEEGNITSEAEYGGDISIPDLQEGNWLSKYDKGGKTGDPNKPYNAKTNPTGYVSMKNNKDWFDNHANWSNTGNKNWDAKVRQQVMTGRFGVDPNSGALIKLPQSEWTNVSAEDKRLATDKRQWTAAQKQTSWEKKVKPQIVQSTKDLITNPVMMAPGAILTGGMASGIPAVSRTLGAIAPALNTPIAGIAGATPANAIGSYFAADALVNRLPQVPGQISQGDYAGAAENILTGGLDLAGANMVAPIYKGASNLVSEGKNLYNTVATGESILPVAWKSPAVGLGQEASAKMFQGLANSGKLNDAERALIVEYQANSRPFTGRAGWRLDQTKQDQLNNIIKKYNLNITNDAILTRKFNPTNNSLGATVEGNRLNFGNRPTSFSAGVGHSGYGSGSVDRIVVPNRYAKQMGDNFLANQYDQLSNEALGMVSDDARGFASGIGKTNESVNTEREVIGTGLDFKRIGKVKNDIGGYDWIVKPKTNSKFGSLSSNNQVNQANEGAASYGNWMAEGAEGPAVRLATDANNTIQREGINIMQDLASPEGASRLRNQFKTAMPNATEEQLDHLVGNRLREVNTALEKNKARFYLLYGKGAKGTPTFDVEKNFFPPGNAHFANSSNPFPGVEKESAPSRLFKNVDPFDITAKDNAVQSAKDYGDFANPNYNPGTITLGEGYQFDPHTVRHEAHGHGVQGSGWTNKLPLEHDLIELAKPKSLRDKVWFEWKKRTDPAFLSNYNYFTKGSGTSREAYPYLVENRSLMKERGLINDTYDEVTADQLLEHKKIGNTTYAKNSNDRFLQMYPSWKIPKVADIWNKAPAVVPTVGAAGLGLKAGIYDDNKTNQQKYGGWLNKYAEGGESEITTPAVTTETTKPPSMGPAGPIMPLNLLQPLIKGAAAVKEFFTGEDEPKPKVSELEETMHIKLNDPRKIRMTTGSKMNPNRDLMGGDYVLNDIQKMIKEAKKRGLSLDDVYNLSAIDLQETGWGKTDDNMGHVLNYKGKDPIDAFLNAYQDKMKTANRLKYKDPYLRLQVYNGLGKVYPETEKWYHGFKANAFYGVPVPKTGLDLKKNPLYGKQIVDLRDNILKKNPEFVNFITETYNSKKMGGQLNWSNKYK